MALGGDESEVDESYAVTIPASVREDLDLEPGDRLRWTVDEAGQLVAEIIRERYGLGADPEPIDMGETDAVEMTEESDWD